MSEYWDRVVEDSLTWAESGDMNCGQRTEKSIKNLATEVRRLTGGIRYLLSKWDREIKTVQELWHECVAQDDEENRKALSMEIMQFMRCRDQLAEIIGPKTETNRGG